MECNEHFPNYVNSISFFSSPQGLILSSGGADKLIHTYNIVDKELTKTLIGHHDNICSLDYQDDGTLISCSWDCTIKIWREAEEIETLQGHSKAVWCVEAVSPGVYLTGTAI